MELKRVKLKEIEYTFKTMEMGTLVMESRGQGKKQKRRKEGKSLTPR